MISPFHLDCCCLLSIHSFCTRSIPDINISLQQLPHGKQLKGGPTRLGYCQLAWVDPDPESKSGDGGERGEPTGLRRSGVWYQSTYDRKIGEEKQVVSEGLNTNIYKVYLTIIFYHN
jgi:hypothetical protein